MGRKAKNAPDDLDRLLLDAHHMRSEHGLSATLPSVPISKRIMEFAQFFGALKYRDMRDMLKVLTKSRKCEETFLRLASSRLPFIPDNWAFLFLKGHKGIDPPGFIPETLEKGRGLVARVSEIKQLLEKDKEVRAAYDSFEETWELLDQMSYPLLSWIHEQFKNGTLDYKINFFKNKNELNKKTKISKNLISNLINPCIAEIVSKEAELPDLSVGERQSLQLLLNKIDTMNELELEIKNKILKLRNVTEENAKQDGYLVVVQRSSFIEKNYGDIRASGKHYKIIDTSLEDLLKKKRKLTLTTKKGVIEFCEPLIREEMSIREKLHEEKEWKEFVFYRIPYEIAQLHDKKYTTYPDNHFALLRNTPPKTLLDKTEIRFFDFLKNESPHDKEEKKVVRRKKIKFLELIGGTDTLEHRNQSRLAERIENTYIQKAINLNILKSGTLEHNSEGEDVYVFEYIHKD